MHTITRFLRKTITAHPARMALTALLCTLLVATLALSASQAAAATTTVTVDPANPSGWGFFQETATGSGSFIGGPATPPLGSGSARLRVDATGREIFGTTAYAGTRLDQLTKLRYSTYRSSADAGNILAISLQLDVDYDLNDANTDWQGRLVYEPYMSGGSVPQNTWQTWDPLDANAKWWASGAPGNTDCQQSNPCTLSGLLANYANAGIRAGGVVQFKAGGPWSGFDGNVDAFTIGVNGSETTYDFEPETQCTSVCYANAATGDDSFGGTSARPKKTIQAAIDQVAAGGTVNVYPGNYDEKATNRFVRGTNGPHQFGLFIGQGKGGITIQGVTAGGAPIVDYHGIVASVKTNATNNFGYSGIFVEADNVTIAGLKILNNIPSDNKTIEVIGDNFALKHSHINVTGGGALYLADWDTPYITSYTIEGNSFDQGALIAISSGPGLSGLVDGRRIINNTFTFNPGDYWPAISFTGGGTGVPWFVHDVGGAIITGNSFSDGEQYIRARGNYISSQFDWDSYWNDNTFDKAAIVGQNPPADVREFSYTSGSYTFNHVRRIGAKIQPEVDNAQAGDTVLVKAGTYNEQVTIAKNNLTLQGAGKDQTAIQGAVDCQSSSGNTGGITLSGSRSNITIADLKVTGFDDGIQMFTGPLSNILIEDVEASNNCRHGIWSQAFGIEGLTVRRVTASSNNSAGSSRSGRGIWIINGAKQNITIADGVFNNNRLVGIDVSDGNVTGLRIVGNTVIGNGDSGIGVLGLQGPGANLIDRNTVTDNGRFGIEIKNSAGSNTMSGAGSIVVSHNIVARTATATDPRDHAGIAIFRRFPVLPDNVDQPKGVVVIENKVSGYHRKPSGSTGDGFGIVVEGIDNTVTKNIIANNDIGIQVQGSNPSINAQSTDYFDRGDAVSGDAVVNRNTISGNGIGFRNVAAAQPIDGTCNWWGASSGPGPVGSGSGDTVSANVDYTPWLRSSNLDGPCDGMPDLHGPLTSDLVASPNPVAINTLIVLNAKVDDTTTGGSNISSAEYRLNGGLWESMQASDTAFDSPAENVKANIGPFPAADVIEVCVRGTDIHGNTGLPTCILVAVYDPSAGFVTGGGWITSPAGAYTPDLSLTGKATFGFVSKYKKGVSVPTGTTEFQFKVANLNFSSSAYEWLVVAGAKAQYKGSGTINGQGDYGFMLTAIDGQLNGGGGVDKFRIKIWNKATDAIVYDNQIGAADTDNPSTAIDGGSIVIHK